MNHKLRWLLPVLCALAISTTMTSDRGKYFEIAKNIEVFTNLYKELNTYYVDDLDPSAVMRTGLDAMLGNLDPYTNYISESEIEGYRFLTEGRYRGIGARLEMVDGKVTLIERYAESPAAKAGLQVGDRLIAVDGQSAVGKSVDEVSAILKGYPGTGVELTLERPGTKAPVKTTLIRDEVSIENVPYNGMVADGIGYVALTTFTRQAGKNVGEAVQKMKEENPDLKGIVFDLRDNGGGLLTEAVNVSNVFIPKGEMVVSTRGKVKDWDRSFKTLNAPVDQEIPLIVLINNNSASASEIVSGVIQDYDRGVLVGQRSYGKGLVQNTRDVGYNSKIKLTTAKYYIPSGRCIQSVEYENGEPVDIADEKRAKFETANGRTVLDGGGVKPDVVVDKDKGSEILKTLQDDYIVFDFVTQWALDHETIPSVEEFQFTDWANFVSYLKKRDFKYDTESERLLEKLREESQKSAYLTAADVDAMEDKIEAAKKQDLETNREVIIDMIEKEIASRYYDERGKVRMGLRNDPEVELAIELINDPKRYRGILD